MSMRKVVAIIWARSAGSLRAPACGNRCCQEASVKILVILSVAVLAMTCAGCTHMQLRYNFIHQADSMNEIFERQVLDNLALFMVNPSALPSFSYPDSGASNVTDTGALNGVDPTTSFLSKFYALQLSRQNYDQWTLVPV